MLNRTLVLILHLILPQNSQGRCYYLFFLQSWELRSIEKRNLTKFSETKARLEHSAPKSLHFLLLNILFRDSVMFKGPFRHSIQDVSECKSSSLSKSL